MNKQNKFITRYFLFLIVILLTESTIINPAFGQKKEATPNVIFVICDQMRGDAIGALGNKNARTPNLDLLIEKGVVCTKNYANNSVCLPSRISMFSGKYPHQTGVYNNRYRGERLKYMNSLPWFFKQAGYKTAYVGKNHTYANSELSGFDYVSIRDREEFRAYSKYVPPNWHSDTFWPEEECYPALNTGEAIEFINQNNKDVPFFLTVSYFDPHPPYMAPSKYTSRYCAEDMELPEYIDPATLSKRLADHQKSLNYDKTPESDLKETLRYYHASIEWGVDTQLGAIIDVLKEKGIEKNTILIFTSDHGDFMGQHKMVRKGMFLYDALLHVPMIWYAPGYIKKGLKISSLTQNVDILPTLLEFAGIASPDNIAGRSLKPLLEGNIPEKDSTMVLASATYSDFPDNYWDNPEPWFDPESEVPFHTRVSKISWQDVHRTMMVRKNQWKLIVSDTHEPELYKMDEVHFERENLYGISGYEAIYESLKKELDKQFKE